MKDAFGVDYPQELLKAETYVEYWKGAQERKLFTDFTGTEAMTSDPVATRKNFIAFIKDQNIPRGRAGLRLVNKLLARIMAQLPAKEKGKEKT